MRVAYFDCFSGVCGSMIIGALLDAGLDLEWLETELSGMKISGYRLRAEKTLKNGISGTGFHVDADEGVPHRSAAELLRIVDESDLEPDVKESSKSIMSAVAGTEARIHNRDVSTIHMHEVAGIDSIIDVVGSVLALKKLGVEAVYSSPIHVGTGFVECAHGTLPVPAPATVALLEGIPVYSRGIDAELATPTGVAILRVLSRGFGPFPSMKIERTGYGAGDHELEIPNLLRVTIGESADDVYEHDDVVLVETNLDDMNPEFFGHVSDLLWERGALDVYTTPIYMKKNRPATMLSVLISPDRLDDVISTLAMETTTLGMRINHVERKKLARETVEVQTKWGPTRVKVGRVGDRIANVAPEYEDCRRIAREHGVALKDVYDEVIANARRA
ncbi:MAG: nickel pincer cofactor biosynthesis protein LarC [Candidatus Eisenbacteria sp.]|nr:nickel pincer cofactor biosynthesis protein LarC [Candidatus Eisenbacteria bacterium]